jgi:hypothetical protein
LDVLDFVSEGWQLEKNILQPNEGNVQYHQYAYVDMLWMISLAYLLDIPGEKAKVLADALDKDMIESPLYEAILTASVPGRKNNFQYEQNAGKHLYPMLRQAMESNDNVQVQELLNTYLKDWPKIHKNAGFINLHKSRFPLYFGYWSFEAASIAKMKGLAGNLFGKNVYFPVNLLPVI